MEFIIALLLGLSSLFGTPDTDQETVQKEITTLSTEGGGELGTGGEGGGDDGDD